jgi:hypothetical protein
LEKTSGCGFLGFSGNDSLPSGIYLPVESQKARNPRTS